ncbi:protein NLRC3-like isoform X2 [Denticeps clupeoides]|nr:protein NLRC3-like isoform X2 [Denticeps clupeoides]
MASQQICCTMEDTASRTEHGANCSCTNLKDSPGSPGSSCVSMRTNKSIDRPWHFKKSGQQKSLDSGSMKKLKANRQNTRQASDLERNPLAVFFKVQEELKTFLKMKFQHLFEGTAELGNPTLLSKIYTQLYITKSWSGSDGSGHEVTHIVKTSWMSEILDKSINCNDIFISSKQNKPIRTVLTKGLAGIGKTVSVQKFILDWAEGKANQDVHLILPLPFRELNLMKEGQFSLLDLLQHFLRHIKELRSFINNEFKIIFIFDGLDECRLALDFQKNKVCRDLRESTSVDVLLTNLIKGNLLPSALLWITSRPAAAYRISPECVDQMTEIRGFSDLQKDEYFRKRVSDQNMASRIISHLKSSRTLYTMCHIPIFCWLSATVLEKRLGEAGGEIPRTLTQMYTHFLIIQTSVKKEKFTGRKETEEGMMFKLGKVAFQQLEKGNLIFYDQDLRDCSIDVTEASVYSGVCTQIFKEEFGLYQGKVFSFVHLSLQEHLAALYVFLCFSNRGRNVDQHQTSELSALFKASTIDELHKSAVEMALQSKNGHLDLFLCFLLGFSVGSNQSLLRELLPRSGISYQSTHDTAELLKEKIRADNHYSDQYVNLFYCLNELNHHAVVDHTQWISGTLIIMILIPGNWTIERFELKTLPSELLSFDLKKYIKTSEKDLTELLDPDDVLEKLLPIITASRSAKLHCSYLTYRSCATLASALRSYSSNLTELETNVGDEPEQEVNPLISALEDPHCKLEKLTMLACNPTRRNCAALASALRSKSSRMRELIMLPRQMPEDSDLKLLYAIQKDPRYKLENIVISNDW